MKISCPICDGTFRVLGEAEDSVLCPYCRAPFDFDAEGAPFLRDAPDRDIDFEPPTRSL